MRSILFLFLILSSVAFAEFGGGGANCVGVSDGLVLTASGGLCTFSSVAGTGDVVGPASSVDSEITLFSGTSGKSIKRASGTGLCKATSGVASFATLVNADVSTSAAIARSKTASGTAYRIVANDSGGVLAENAAITASRAVASDSNGQLVAAATTATELGYVNGVTSSIQTQLNAMLPLAGGTLTGDVKKSNCYVTPKESDLGNSGSSITINLSTATLFTITLNAATPTLTFSNPVAGCAYAVVLTEDSPGGRVPTFAGTTALWGNSGSKTLTTTAGAVDKFSCVYNGAITSLLCDLGTDYK